MAACHGRAGTGKHRQKFDTHRPFICDNMGKVSSVLLGNNGTGVVYLPANAKENRIGKKEGAFMWQSARNTLVMIFLLFCGGVSLALAQSSGATTASITGSIKDTQGAVVAGAAITVRQTETN